MSHQNMSHQNLFHGVLLINKQQSWTSHDVVQKIRTLLHQKTVGHAGTLDPSATGLLVILLGSATKLSSYFLNHDKRYRLGIKFGLTTDTYDLEGQVQTKKKVSLPFEELQNLFQKELGLLGLKVPIFSATKWKGKKLYDYARAGKQAKTIIKEMNFYDLEIHKITKDEAELSVSCSKGSYIRSWVHHLGEQIKVGACLSSLNRLSSGFFQQKNSLSLDQLCEQLQKNTAQDSQSLKQLLLPTKSFFLPLESLPHLKSIELNKRNARELLNGRIPQYLREQSQNQQKQVNKTAQNQILKIAHNDKLIALLQLRPFERLKVLNRFLV